MLKQEVNKKKNIKIKNNNRSNIKLNSKQENIIISHSNIKMSSAPKFEKMKLNELKEYCKKNKIKGFSGMKKI